MGRGVQYFGLTLQKICRLAACHKKQNEHPSWYIQRQDVITVLGIEEAQASRFIREMIRRGLIECIFKPNTREKQGQRSQYRLTRKWQMISRILDMRSILPGTCEVSGCNEMSELIRFRGKFFCEKHIMTIGCAHCQRWRTDKCAMCAERKSKEGSK